MLGLCEEKLNFIICLQDRIHNFRSAGSHLKMFDLHVILNKNIKFHCDYLNQAVRLTNCESNDGICMSR